MHRSLMIAALLLTAAPFAAGHELKPCYLGLRELADGRFSVGWKTPRNRAEGLPLRVVFPPHCAAASPKTTERLPDAFVMRYVLDCGQAGLAGQRISFDGPEFARDDVLVRIEWRDGRTASFLVKASESAFVFPAKPAATEIAWDYMLLGIDHILLGIDHLLFVLALLMIVRGKWKLVKAITAFTIAHSITLSAAVLGLVNVPTGPVEAAIALSIVFLASELMRVRAGRDTLSTRRPWVVSFTFGLLHGFGFAGALSAIGLPQQAIPLALALFNVGVEVGQLAFVAAVLAAAWLARAVKLPHPPWTRQVATYAIGSVASFWLIERVLGLWA